MTVALDASVTMAWCFPAESNAYAEGVLDFLRRDSAIVPPVWRLEVANVLLVGERRARLTSAQTQRFLQLLQSLPIAVAEDDAFSRWDMLLPLARDHELSAYDASYLALANFRGVQLATQDARLRAAAIKCGVYFTPGQ
ncbi:MAG: type II toxin-antitoxin system VapC family toxin [Chloroflexi bacterium]|nr:type II toxin-antitoxin system VapC family toxin [Chloroflexota bacterium]